MIGGETETVKRLDPVFASLAPGAGSIPRTAGRKDGGTAERGYLHCGPHGAGHFVKMVHNGIEYGLMAAYAEGLNILRHANVGQSGAGDRRRDDTAPEPRALPLRLQPRRRHRAVAARQRRLVVAARSDRRVVGVEPGSRRVLRTRVRFRRGPVDHPRGDRRRRARARSDRIALRAVRFPRRSRLPESRPLRHALRFRRPPREIGDSNRGHVPFF